MNIQTITHKDISLISLTNPGELEIKYLKNNFGFDTLHLEDYINRIQAPKIEVFKNYSLIVVDFPFFKENGTNHPPTKPLEKTNKPLIESLINIPKNVPLPQFPAPSRKRRIVINQVNFFIGKDYVVILHEGNLDPINNIFSLCQGSLQSRDEYMSDGTVFLAYRILDALVDSCFPILNELSATIDKIDRELENPKSERTLEMISVTRRNIVVFHTMIKPIIPLFKQLEEGKYKELNGTMKLFWGNIVDHLQKIWERIEDNRELLEGISASHESFLASRTTEIVKVLTIFSTIILPLTLFASIYGMNIKGLPVANENYAFFALMLLMVFTAAVMLYIFKLKRWF